METKTLDIDSYLRKIDQVEIMLNEIKEGLLIHDKEFQDSVIAGEEDIREGRMTICRTEEELEDFFNSV
jgi:hypothetical protein